MQLIVAQVHGQGQHAPHVQPSPRDRCEDRLLQLGAGEAQLEAFGQDLSERVAPARNPRSGAPPRTIRVPGTRAAGGTGGGDLSERQRQVIGGPDDLPLQRSDQPLERRPGKSEAERAPLSE